MLFVICVRFFDYYYQLSIDYKLRLHEGSWCCASCLKLRSFEPKLSHVIHWVATCWMDLSFSSPGVLTCSFIKHDSTWTSTDSTYTRQLCHLFSVGLLFVTHVKKSRESNGSHFCPESLLEERLIDLTDEARLIVMVGIWRADKLVSSDNTHRDIALHWINVMKSYE